jgi:predicted  nucleic acid-binding Zn-ribbon protein
MAMILAAILLVLASGADRPGETDPGADAKAAAAQAVADADRQLEAFQHEQDLAKARLELCQRSTRDSAEDYSEKVKRALKIKPELGSFERAMEICRAYLTGKVDEINEQLQELDR